MAKTPSPKKPSGKTGSGRGSLATPASRTQGSTKSGAAGRRPSLGSPLTPTPVSKVSKRIKDLKITQSKTKSLSASLKHAIDNGKLKDEDQPHAEVDSEYDGGEESAAPRAKPSKGKGKGKAVAQCDSEEGSPTPNAKGTKKSGKSMAKDRGSRFKARSALEDRLKNWGWTHHLPTAAQRSKNGRNKGRTLMTWNSAPRQMDRLILNIVYECNIRNVRLPWDEIAHRFYPGSTGDGLLQKLIRVRRELIAEGHLVPPEMGPRNTNKDPQVRGYLRKYGEDKNNLLTVRTVKYTEPHEEPAFPDTTAQMLVHNATNKQVERLELSDDDRSDNEDDDDSGEEDHQSDHDTEDEDMRSSGGEEASESDDEASEDEEEPAHASRSRVQPRVSTRRSNAAKVCYIDDDDEEELETRRQESDANNSQLPSVTEEDEGQSEPYYIKHEHGDFGELPHHQESGFVSQQRPLLGPDGLMDYRHGGMRTNTPDFQQIFSHCHQANGWGVPGNGPSDQQGFQPQYHHHMQLEHQTPIPGNGQNNMPLEHQAPIPGNDLRKMQSLWNSRERDQPIHVQDRPRQLIDPKQLTISSPKYRAQSQEYMDYDDLIASPSSP